MSAYLDRKTILADKIYSDISFFGDRNPNKVFTPHKDIKNKQEFIRQNEKVAFVYF